MFDPAAAFVLAILFAQPIVTLVVLFLIGAMFEHFEHRFFATLALIVLAAVAYRHFDSLSIDYLLAIPAYLFVGIGWAMFRYSRKLRSFVERCKLDKTLSATAYQLKPGNMWPTFMSWVYMWPFSAAALCLSDVFDLIDQFVKRFITGRLELMYRNAMLKAGVSIASE